MVLGRAGADRELKVNRIEAHGNFRKHLPSSWPKAASVT